MTSQFALLAVEREREIAMGAFCDMTAFGAKLHAMKASTVEEEQRLFAFGASILDLIEEFLGKMGESTRTLHSDFHVDDLHGGQRSIRGSLRQCAQLVFADLRVVIGFE